MANSDKNIVIRPSIGSTTEQPSITFTGAGNSSITLKVLDDTQGTLSFEGNQGQVFSINNNLSSGIIYSVNDISGIPIIDADVNANVRLSHYGGNVGVGTTNPRYKLEVGAVGASGTSLWVNNNARITGSLAVGSLSGVGLTSLSDVNTGINTLVDGRVLIYQGGQWIGGPIIGGFNYSTGDPYINNVITLLHMDGANGSTNFYDHSPSAILYSRYGSVAISTAQSKFGGASGYFNGSGSIYVANPNTVFGQISGDFTLECWINWVSAPPGNANGLERTIIGQTNWPESASGNWWWLYGLSTGFGWSVYNGGSGEGVGYNFTWQTNRWYHLAVSRSNGIAYLFLDGALVSSAASTKPLFVDNVRQFSIGGDNAGDATLCNAYIEEVRFTKGVGRYTTSFTPQTTAFPNPFDANFNNVSLLLHMDGANNSTTFTDSSPNALTVSVFGGAKISTTQSKFRGASGLFNGSTDYLTVPYSSLFEIGSGDVTIECWVYVTSSPSNAYDIATTNQAVSGNGWGLRLGSDMKPIFIFNTGGNTGYTDVKATSAISLNTWTHLAGVRYGNNIYIYVNGVSANTPTAVSGTQYSTLTGLSIGRNATNTSWYYAGYIDELRVTKGLARYTSNFSVQTAPFPDQVGISSSLPYSINNLDDVDTNTTAPTSGQALTWNSTNNQWVPGPGSQWVSTFVGVHTLSNVGIATTNPTQRLQVGTGSSVIVIDSQGELGIGTLNPSQPFQVGTGSSVVVIDRDGDLGIGTLNPSTKFHLIGNALISGVVTATRYFGDASQLTAGNASYASTAGIATYATTSGIASVASTLSASGDIITSGVVSATKFVGDGSGLTNLIGIGATGIYLQNNDTNIGAATTINFASNFTVSSLGGIGTIGFNTTSTLTAAAFIGDGSGLINLPLGSQWVTTSAGIHTTSNVGVGTTNPLVSLQVSGNASVSGIVSTGGLISTSSVTLTQSPFFRNTPTISTDYTVTTDYNEMSIGPITINNGVTVTVNSGATWTIV